MALNQHRGFMAFARIAAVMLIGASVSACSSAPDWVDPTTWVGGPDVPPQARADDGQYPDLAKMPARPTASSSDDRQAVAGSLVEAREHVQYSAEALRGGTEAAAPPPEAAPSKEALAKLENAAAAPKKDEDAEEAQPAEEAKAEPAAAPEPQTAEAAPPAPAPAKPAAPPSSTVPGAQPAVPAVASDRFEPSKAPPLDASVSQFVPASIMQQYARTGTIAPASSGKVASKDARQAILGAGQGGSAYYAAPMGPAVAVVQFADGSAALNGAARAAVKSAIAAYKAQGEQGYVRVLGHAGMRGTATVAKMEQAQKRSQARAQAVARELIRQGVPADKVLVDTAGTSAMGKAQAEIFLQG